MTRKTLPFKRFSDAIARLTLRSTLAACGRFGRQ
jgi:hypothetical protein